MITSTETIAEYGHVVAARPHFVNINEDAEVEFEWCFGNPGTPGVWSLSLTSSAEPWALYTDPTRQMQWDGADAIVAVRALLLWAYDEGEALPVELPPNGKKAAR